MRFEAWGAIMPGGPTGYDVVPRVIRTDFVAEWESRRGGGGQAGRAARGEIMASVRRVGRTSGRRSRGRRPA